MIPVTFTLCVGMQRLRLFGIVRYLFAFRGRWVRGAASPVIRALRPAV